MSAGRICVGRIGAPHGVRGLVNATSFTEMPENIAAYGPVETEDGRRLSLAVHRTKKDGLIVAVDGVETRDAAAALRGELLYVPRDRLPGTDAEEWYHADLVGLAVQDESGVPFGRVVAVHDFGAGDLLEIDCEEGRNEFVPFTTEAVPVVDVASERVVVDRAVAGLGRGAESGEEESQ